MHMPLTLSTHTRHRVHGLGAKLLTVCLPRNGKRMLLLTSLFVEVAQIDPTERSYLQELNQRLKLASHVDAMVIPARMHQRFWCKTALSRLLKGRPAQPSEAEIWEAAQRVLAFAPLWVRYDTEERMLMDIREVLMVSRRLVTHRLTQK